MTAPRCKRCHGRMVHIGISGAAELVCARECAGRCPGCLSPRIEPFVMFSYWSPIPTPTTAHMHCEDCGKVFAAEVEPT